MRAWQQSLVRLSVYSLFGGVGAWLALRYASHLPDKIHGAILTAFAVVFVLSDRYFPGLLTNLDALRRTSSFSEWQAERMRAVVDPARRRLWRRWFVLTALKTVIGAAGALIVMEGLAQVSRSALIAVGYGCAFATIPMVISIYRNFRRTQALRDDIDREESERKEKRRLTRELTAGPAHNYSADAHLQNYTKPLKQH